MMKKILFVITSTLLFVAYNSLHDFVSNSVFGLLDTNGKLTHVDRGWDAVTAAWPIALAGALILAVPAALGLAALYMRAAAIDNRELMKNVDDQIANARDAAASAREKAEKAVESRMQSALHAQSHAEQLIIEANQIKADAGKQIAEMSEKLADADSRRSRAFEGFNRIKRKNQQLEAAVTAINSTNAENALRQLGLLDNQTAQEDETL